VVSFCLPATTGRTEGDFVKYNISNGGSGARKVTEAIYARSKDRYQILDMPDVDLKPGESRSERW